MGRWIRRSSPSRKSPYQRFYLPRVEALEDRYVPASPVINTIPVPLNLPVGKSLIIPISGSDPAGGSVTYAVTSNDTNVKVISHPNPVFLQLNVANFGAMVIELFPDVAPHAVSLIEGYAQSGFYNGTDFFRVINNFVIQGGDPTNTGTGGPGYQYDDEYGNDSNSLPNTTVPANAIYSGTGQFGMANAGPDDNGSQFFITEGTQRGLDFNNEIIGQLISGFDVLAAIESTATNSSTNVPTTPVVVTSAQIIQDSHDAAFTLVDTGTTAGTTTLNVTATASTGGVTSQNFTLTEVADTTNDPPFLNPLTSASVTTPATFVSPTSLAISGSNPISFTLNRTDLENDASTFEATAQGTNASNVQVTTSNVTNSSETVTVTPLAGFTGSVQILAGVEEQGATSRGNTTTGSFFDTQVLNLAFNDSALTVGTTPTITAVEGTAASNVTVATFTDADTTAVTGDYKVSINWGDGTALDTTSAVVTGSPAAFTVSGTHTYKQAGKFDVQATITDVHNSGNTTGGDNGGALITSNLASTLNATVTSGTLLAQGVAVTATQGVALSNVTVATFTDSNTNGNVEGYTATINWGDNTTTSAGTVTGSAGGTFTVTGSHTYSTSGTFPVSTAIAEVITSGLVTPATATANTTATVAASSETQIFVDALFQKLLQRPADTTGETAFISFLNNGGSRATLITAIEESPEARTLQVNNLYEQYLGRMADPVGLSLDVPYLTKGGSIAGLTAILLGSPEYFNLKANGTNTGWLSAIFQDTEKQSIDPTSQALGLKLLGEGLSLQAVAGILVSSANYNVDLVEQSAELYLGHAADPALVNAIVATPPNLREALVDMAIANILASAEFFQDN